jgi:hypothetical protein
VETTQGRGSEKPKLHAQGPEPITSHATDLLTPGWLILKAGIAQVALKLLREGW